MAEITHFVYEQPQVSTTDISSALDTILNPASPAKNAPEPIKSKPEATTPETPLRILALDGGMRGVITLTILKEFERVAQKKVCCVWLFVWCVTHGLLPGPRSVRFDRGHQHRRHRSCLPWRLEKVGCSVPLRYHELGRKVFAITASSKGVNAFLDAFFPSGSGSASQYSTDDLETLFKGLVQDGHLNDPSNVLANKKTHQRPRVTNLIH